MARRLKRRDGGFLSGGALFLAVGAWIAFTAPGGEIVVGLALVALGAGCIAYGAWLHARRWIAIQRSRLAGWWAEHDNR